MIEYKEIKFDLPDDKWIKVSFKQYQPGGDWICLMSDETMDDLVDIIQGYTDVDAHGRTLAVN